jgi:hypothetical protein
VKKKVPKKDGKEGEMEEIEVEETESDEEEFYKGKEEQII